ncbi:MAG: hypothetical protein GY874_17055 [Desulfobacteraceae bacterium]|nr:hypothetical protein [Desulfobacteraceae bacterium]
MKVNKFQAKRIDRKYRQTINAIPEKIFPLLCPVREAQWLEGWSCNMIYSESGLAENGAVFSTSSEGEEDTVWVITKHDCELWQVEFTRFTHNCRICVLKIAVTPKDQTRSYVDICYTYTGITAAGNNFIDNFTEEAFLDAVIFWEKSMNYFLETGQKLKKA